MCVWSWSKHSGWYTVFEPRDLVVRPQKNIRKMRRLGVHQYMYSVQLVFIIIFMSIHLVSFYSWPEFVCICLKWLDSHVKVDLSPSPKMFETTFHHPQKNLGFSQTGGIFTLSKPLESNKEMGCIFFKNCQAESEALRSPWFFIRQI